MSQLKILGFRHGLELFDRRTGELVHSEVKFNRVPQAALDFLIQAPFGDVASIPSFYCGLFINNFLASAGTSAADIPSVMGEFLDYSEPTRPEWVRQYADGTYDNLASKAVFTPTREATVYGSFMVSNAIKGSNTGLLLSVARFATAKQLSVDLEAKLVCGLTYIPTT